MIDVVIIISVIGLLAGQSLPVLGTVPGCVIHAHRHEGLIGSGVRVGAGVPRLLRGDGDVPRLYLCPSL